MPKTAESSVSPLDSFYLVILSPNIKDDTNSKDTYIIFIGCLSSLWGVGKFQ